jgi:ArsR family transcriptional regulator
VGEAARVLRAGGRLVILDLKAHDQAWVRSRFGDQRLGFPAGELESLLRGASFASIRVTTGARQTGNPFTVLIASGVKPNRP